LQRRKRPRGTAAASFLRVSNAEGTVTAFEAPDWAGVFLPDSSLFESCLRGTVVYFTVLVLVRLAPKRQIGSVGLTDVLLLVLVSECVSQALSAKSNSVANGAVAVAALLFWDYVLDWAGFKSRWVRKALEHEPVPLIRNGRPLEDRLQKERITHDELLCQLRLHGVDAFSRVKTATLESSGKVSVVGRAKARPEEDEAAPADFDRALEKFLAAAEALRGAVEWHVAQADDHTAAAKAARKALSEHGVAGTRLLGHGAKALDRRENTNGRHRDR
jgi:uncharacterized membrane protein YcaP (DUF421 family)